MTKSSELETVGAWMRVVGFKPNIYLFLSAIATAFTT